MATYVITGTSRGIGLELVRQLAAEPSSQVKTVIAITRDNKSTALDSIVEQSEGRVANIVITDITDEKTILKAVPEIEKALAGHALDILINNAGMADWGTDVKSMTSSAMVDVFKTNVGSVQAMTTSLLPLLEQGHGKKVINISTTLGSIAYADRYIFAPTYGYKTSKAALNMLNKLYAQDYADKGFTFLLITPGWLKTDLGSQDADLPVEVGVKAVLEIVHSATTADNGKFKNIKVAGWEQTNGLNSYDGAEVPW